MLIDAEDDEEKGSTWCCWVLEERDKCSSLVCWISEEEECWKMVKIGVEMDELGVLDETKEKGLEERAYG